ncbi:hypothetical protein [Tateyamaria pelophila]|uniref:hypothetical protein n=1 Tax=Tateyamaria pelophila TaxID=328415 RepID=UPI001CC0D61A|nr:hypothetical protein [Tateyamaria pelophila]
MTEHPFAEEDRFSISEKVRFLSDAAAYPHGPKSVEVIETHMSWVFLADDLVYKLKKPVRYDFLDFGTIEKRCTAVFDEVRLNRRLAPDVYLSERALRIGADGRLTLNACGQAIDWMVEMRRLAQEQDLECMIASGGLTQVDVTGVADLLATFYQRLPSANTDQYTYYAQFADEAQKTEDILTDPTLELDEPLLTSALDGFWRAFEIAAPLLRHRVEKGFVVEGHGDLRPQHVFLSDPPVIIDCIEFSLRFRLVDPLDEVVFLGMECAHLGASWVAGSLMRRLNSVIGEPPNDLANFYWRYRALLRARLALLHLVLQPDRTPEKWRPLARAYVALSVKPDLMRQQQAGLQSDDSREGAG